MANFFLATNTGYYKNGMPTNECLEFYKQRSGHSIYCSIVGNVVIDGGFQTNKSTGRISKNSTWRRLSDIIIENGTLPGIQLATTWEKFVGQKDFISCNWNDYIVKTRVAIKKINISSIIDQFDRSIQVAIEHHFGHVQIHAAHGYLLSLLLDPYWFEKIDDVIQGLIYLLDKYKTKVELSLRVSAYCGFSRKQEAERLLNLKKLFSIGFDYIDLSDGYYNFDKNLIYPKSSSIREERARRCFSVAKEFPEQKFIVSCGPSVKIQNINNVSIGLCREIIANPLYFENMQVKCDLCGSCHYYSQGRESLSCSKWDNLIEKEALHN